MTRALILAIVIAWVMFAVTTVGVVVIPLAIALLARPP